MTARGRPRPTAGALRLGTRRSALATAQAELVADALTATGGVEVELVPITTYGDESQREQLPLETIGGTGVFATELRRALLAGEIDIAVHSLKDLPDRSSRRAHDRARSRAARTRATSSSPATA